MSLTLLDLIKTQPGAGTLVPLLDEVKRFAPEVDAIPARQIDGTSYKLRQRSAVPSATFTGLNEGSDNTKSSYETRTIECFPLRLALQVDRALIQGSIEDMLFEEAAAALRGAKLTLGSQIVYGRTRTEADAAKGFPGLQELHSYWSTELGNDALTVDAGGTTAGTGSSVYALSTGAMGIQILFGGGSAFNLTPWREETALDGSSKPFDAYVAHLTCWVGLQCASRYAVGRLKDATAESGKGITDALVAELISKMPVGAAPDMLLMNRRSAFQLQRSRTATTIYSGQKSSSGMEVMAPYPTESNGVPIIVTDSITSTETLS
jgi:hypothetical protein